MTILPRLLAATDLSIPARHAAERAALVGSEQKAQLELLHVIAPELFDRLRRLAGGSYAAVEQQMLDTLNTELQSVAELLYRQYGVNAGVHASKA